jgi:hypothetical protein
MQLIVRPSHVQTRGDAKTAQHPYLDLNTTPIAKVTTESLKCRFFIADKLRNHPDMWNWMPITG